MNVLQCLLILLILDAGGDVLQMMPQIMPVGAGFLLRDAQCLNLTDGLMHLQVKIAFQLLQTQPCVLLFGNVNQEQQVRRTAHKRHELHNYGRTGEQQVGINAGGIVKRIVHRGHNAELTLHRPRILRHRPDGRCGLEQQNEQRHGDDHFHSVLHGVSAGEDSDRDQRQPAPQLTAQVRRQHGNHRPQAFVTERAQREHKRQVGVQRIQIASEARVHTEVGDAGQAEDHQRVQQHALFRLGRPVDIAECRRERDAEQRNGNGVAKVNGECNHVRNTCSFWKACSRYASLMSL